jgi:hypothetical protein
MDRDTVCDTLMYILIYRVIVVSCYPFFHPLLLKMASCDSKTLISGQGLARVVEYSTSTWYYKYSEYHHQISFISYLSFASYVIRHTLWPTGTCRVEIEEQTTRLRGRCRFGTTAPGGRQMVSQQNACGSTMY